MSSFNINGPEDGLTEQDRENIRLNNIAMIKRKVDAIPPEVKERWKMKEIERINSKKAKEEFAERKRMQDEHIEKRFGAMRRKEIEISNTFVDFSVLNFVLTLHDFSHLSGMDVLNGIQKMMLVHYGEFERKVKKMEGALGSEAMKRLEIDPDLLYPTAYCTRGLKEIQEAAQARAKAGKYGIKAPKKLKIVT